MSVNLQVFLDSCQSVISTGQSTEHSYRKALETLLNSVSSEVTALNEPKRQKVGAPDFILFKKDLPVAYLEAKDMVISLENQLRISDQITRYQALGNLCFTNNLEWIFYQGKEEIARTTIAKLQGNQIIPQPENFELLESLLVDFVTKQTITIRSPVQLAAKMAEKSRLLKAIVFNTLESDQVSKDIESQYQAFKEDLIHDLSHDEFADIYAQTIAYGLFTARFYDPTLPTFSRDEARSLLPKSNPFLRKFFDHVAGIDMEARVVWVIDDLIQLFRHVDVDELLKDFGTKTKQTDPILHFYETFLGQYDPAKRKARGVYYTPQPVVDFIVRSVDQILKQDFGLPKGLADSSKVTKQIPENQHKDYSNLRVETAGNNTKKYFVDTHKVQILDPATGTGTFPLAVIKHIEQSFGNMKGMWPQYVAQDLIPRLHGFEIMMSSYSMAHLKLAMYLRESGVNLTGDQRLQIYLTNSLEEGQEDTRTLFSAWLSNEAREANNIKNQTPVMVVIGNPPYSGVSKNNSDFIIKLINDYKFVDGHDLNERKHWLNDDYVKFIRFAENFVEKNEEGILGFITNHSYLDNPTFRGMREHLLKTFDKIYIVDLHGNSLKKETNTDGSKDENVFDIQAGTAILIGVKTKTESKNIAKVYHIDIYGKRQNKYDWLDNNSISTAELHELEPHSPYYFFVTKDMNNQAEYEKGIKLNDLFSVNSVGFVSANDKLNISLSKKEQQNKMDDLQNLSEFAWRQKYSRSRDSRDWKYAFAKKDAEINYKEAKLVQVCYRPFDIRWTIYTGTSRGLYASPQPKVMKHMVNRDNLGLAYTRQVAEREGFNHVIICNNIVDNRFTFSSKGIVNLAPLYIYPDGQSIGLKDVD